MTWIKVLIFYPVCISLGDSRDSCGQVGQTSVYSTDPVISVGTDNTGQFLCTAVNSVGPSLTASLVVEIRGEVVIVILGSSLFIL